MTPGVASAAARVDAQDPCVRPLRQHEPGVEQAPRRAVGRVAGRAADLGRGVRPRACDADGCS